MLLFLEYKQSRLCWPKLTGVTFQKVVMFRGAARLSTFCMNYTVEYNALPVFEGVTQGVRCTKSEPQDQIVGSLSN